MIVESPVVIGFEDDVPYAFLLVELAEQEELLVAGNLVDAEPFRGADRPTGGGGVPSGPRRLHPPPVQAARGTRGMTTGEQRNRVAIVGVGYSKVERRSPHTLGQLAVSACTAALDDAGLKGADIDGVSNYPTPSGPFGVVVDGIHVVGVEYISQAMGLDNLRWSCSITGGTVSAALVQAVHALTAGACNYVLVWRAMHNPVGVFGRISQPLVGGSGQFTAPWGFGHNVIRFALPYSRYMARYGARREHLATFMVRNRANAADNPDAVFFRRPITLDEYLESPMIAEPLSLLDCDMPVDGCGALVLTTADRARDLKQQPVYVTGAASLGLSTRRSINVTLENMMESGPAPGSRPVDERRAVLP